MNNLQTYGHIQMSEYIYIYIYSFFPKNIWYKKYIYIFCKAHMFNILTLY